MMPREALSYNQVPYPNLSHYTTHPDQICTMSRLLGLAVAPVENCRVLELGSAAGGNIIPMAYGLPGSEFVGVDISEVQVSNGQKKIKSLGLKNISLHCMDILQMSADLGQFDYIIAHGIFSWVPDAVQEKILDLCHTSLSPLGVAFISYNTYPGWHMINIARGIMRYHTRDIQDPQERASKARSILRFYADADQSNQNGYYGFLKMYVDYLEGNNGATPKFDSALLHDEMEDLNQPFYLHEFVDRIGKHELQYLGDLSSTRIDAIPNSVMDEVQKNARDLIELEQSTDFLVNQTFRKTLVCQKDVQINRKVKPEQARHFYFLSQAAPVEEKPEIHAKAIVEFRSPIGLTLKMDHPLSKAAMLSLAAAWPAELSFEQLVAAAKAWLERDGSKVTLTPTDLMVLAANMLRAFSYNPSLVELHSYRPKQMVEVPECPLASKVARYDLTREDSVTNLRHERVVLEGLTRFIFPFLDGKHTKEDLMRLVLDGPVAQGLFTLEEKSKELPVSEQHASLAIELDQSLDWLAHAGLLVDLSALGGDAHGI
jgi:methyltransferase-like protein/SAM-dependent methyltransferase